MQCPKCQSKNIYTTTKASVCRKCGYRGDARDFDTATTVSTSRICLHCGYTWTSRVPNPSQCPSCKSYRWNQPKTNNAANHAEIAERQSRPTRAGYKGGL